MEPESEELYQLSGESSILLNLEFIASQCKGATTGEMQAINRVDFIYIKKNLFTA